MSRVVVTRLLATPPFLVGLSLVCFLLAYLAPGTIVDTLASQPGIPAELVDVLRARYGYDLPWHQQYWNWLSGLFWGDWGHSFRFQRPVFDLLWISVPYTVILVVGGYLLAIIVGVGLSIWGVRRPGGLLDTLCHLGALALASIHPIVSTVCLLVLASVVDWLPVGGAPHVGDEASLFTWTRHAMLPIVALGLALLPGFYLQSRGLFSEIVKQPHVLAAKARGQSETGVVFRQILPVASGPLVALAGAELSTTLNAALLVEVIVAWPGLGRLAWLSLNDQDVFLLMGSLLCGGMVLLFGNLLADVILVRSDPRVRLESHHV